MREHLVDRSSVDPCLTETRFFGIPSSKIRRRM